MTTTARFDGTPAETIDATAHRRLRLLNLGAAGAHLTSGLAMVVLGNDFALEVSSFDLNGPPGTPISEGEIRSLADVRLSWVTASFAFVSAAFHLLVASPPGFTTYLNELGRGMNRFRWVEYSVSSTIMILVIMLLTGISELTALIGVAGANIAMILFGWIMEMVNDAHRPVWWAPFWFGTIAGAAPWVALVAHLAAGVADGSQGPPKFVYGILVSIFVLFNCFALNQWLQYRRRGRWRDPLFAERVYLGLSLTAKLALAWQIFANTLVG